MANFKELISLAGYTIEALGVLVIIAGSLYSSLRFLFDFRKQENGMAYRALRQQLGHSIILGLEFLIAGDIIRTVVVALTLKNIALLGLLILIRSFLSFILHLEIEGRWPWQQARYDDAK
jgi:uncharacterized membrane protein